MKKIAPKQTSLATRDKLLQYPLLLRAHLEAVNPSQYTLIELNCGYGYNELKQKDGAVKIELGTPVIASRVLDEYKDVRSNIIAVDSDKNAVESLRNNFSKISVGLDKAEVFHAHNEDPEFVEALKAGNNANKGLIFFDPFNPPTKSAVDLYQESFPNYDLLVRLNLQQCYRDIGSVQSGIKAKNAYVISDLTQSKVYTNWMISNPRYTLQWCWLFATNNDTTYEKMVKSTKLFHIKEDLTPDMLLSPIFKQDNRWTSRWDNKNIAKVFNAVR